LRQTRQKILLDLLSEKHQIIGFFGGFIDFSICDVDNFAKLTIREK